MQQNPLRGSGIVVLLLFVWSSCCAAQQLPIEIPAAPQLVIQNLTDGALPLDGRGGYTLYDRIGDLFGWLCVGLGIGILGLSYMRRRVTA